MLSAIKAIFARRRQMRDLLSQYTGLRIGSKTVIEDAIFGRHNSVGPYSELRNVSIGDYSYIGSRSIVASTRIGRFCSIAPEVNVGSGSHPSRGTISTHPAFYLRRPEQGWTFADGDLRSEYRQTIVGNDVWIGAKVVIRDGVTVGDGAIIGAGAIVLRDVEPYAVYAGVPARLIRYRFDAETIEALLRLRWWEKDEAWLRQHASLFTDVEAFAAHAI